MLLYVIGFLAQVFFSARILLQWILSERARQVLSPSLFWIFSVAGAYWLCIYGWMRDDFSIILGQFISYYIYLWNLKEKGIWRRLYAVLRAVLLLTPVVAVLWVVTHNETFIDDLFRNENIPLWLICFGSAGQILFTLRFVYQLFYSRVFAFAPVLLTLLRGVVVIFVATIVDTMQLVVSGGVLT